MAAGVECGRQEPCAEFKGVEGGWASSPPRRTELNGRPDLSLSAPCCEPHDPRQPGPHPARRPTVYRR